MLMKSLRAHGWLLVVSQWVIFVLKSITTTGDGHYCCASSGFRAMIEEDKI